jgi:hypothetical protein
MTPRAALGVLMALAAPAQPQAAPPHLPAACAAATEPLAGLIKWVLTEGRPETLPAKILGLTGETELPVMQKAYRNPATHLIHALDVAIIDDRCALVFVIDDVGNVTTWVTDASGAIMRTFHLSHGENEIVPNERYVSEYETIKSYFLERVPAP